MTALKVACIAPHPPVIVHEVGLGQERESWRTIQALEGAAREIAAHRPDTVLLMATHGPMNPGAFFVLASSVAEGDFSRWGAANVRLRFRSDPELAQAIRTEAERAGLAVDLSDRWDGGLDWSATVPLYYLKPALADAKLVPMNVSLLSPEQHFEFGKAVRRAADVPGRRVAVIASADLSHRLSHDGPYGFHPAGPTFDRLIRDAVEAWDPKAIMALDESFREDAGEDAVSSLSFLMGALEGLRVRPRILSYEAPFGVGYMVALIDILSGEDATRASALKEPVPEARTFPVH